MSEMLRAAIVRVRREFDQQVIGVGFLINADKKTILTCAHVINAAIDDSTNQVKPRSLITLDFPFIDTEQRFDARVTHFSPKKADNTDDIAVLEILDDLPADARTVQLATTDTYSGHKFSVYGFPQGFEEDGQYVEGELQERLVNKRIQAVGTSNLGHFVEEGFSGSPVYDKELKVVVGMMMSIANEREKRVAYICPPDLFKKFIVTPAKIGIPLNSIEAPIRSTSMATLKPDGDFVFISYSPDDGKDIAQFIHDLLESNGCYVWIDYKNLSPGADRELEIDEAIYNCRTVIAVITPLAVASQEQRQEWARADEAKKHPIPAVRRPVRLPRRFLLDQPVDLSDGVDTHAELTKLINKLGCSDGGSGDDLPPPTSPMTQPDLPDDLSSKKIIHIDEARAYAMALLRKRDYARLIQWSNELDANLQDDADILALRAVAQDAIGNVKDALDDYTKAIQLDPQDANLYVQRASLNVDVGNVREAFEDFEKALRLNPELKDVIDTETSAVVIFVRHADQLPMPLFDEIEGRSELASAAKQALETGQGILLHGMGGIGKTALSTAIAQEYLSEGRNVLWVNVGSARLETLLNAIGQEIEREPDKRKMFNEAEGIEQKAAYIAERLQSEKPLLVLDDAWNPQETKQFLMTVLPAQYPIIVTTRRTDFEEIQGIIKFDIPELLPDAAVNLYQAINGAEDDIQAIMELCKTLNYHPLAIRLAALKAKSEEQTSAQLLKQIGASSSKNSIRAIFDVVIGDIGQVATNVFIVIGALPVTRVTDEFMAITLDNPVTEIADLLRDLASLGLINPTITSDNEPFYAVHDLTYAYAHDLLVERNRTDELEHRIVKAACLYVERFSNNSTDDFKKLTVEKPTLIASITRAKGYQDHVSIYALVDGLLTFLDYQGYSIDHLNVLAIASEAAETQRDQRKQARYWIELANISAKLGRYKQAIQYFEMALVVSREFGDRRSEGSIIGNLANVYVSLSESNRAIEYYELALNIAREIGDRVSESTILNNIGGAWSALGEKRKAFEFYQQALPLSRAIGDRRGEANTLSNIGGAWSALGEKRKALQFYEQALPLSRAIGDRRGEANTLSNIGTAWDALGEKRKALEFYEQALPLSRAIGDRRGEANTLSNIGTAWDALGEKRKALEFYEQALPLSRAIGDRRGEATTLGNIGATWSALGEMRKALEFYEQALPLSRAAGDRYIEARLLRDIGAVWSALGEKRKALEFYQQALPLQWAVGDRGGEATTLNNIGGAWSALGEKRKALEFYQQALPVFRAVGDRGGEATTLNNIGVVWNALGEKRKALEFYEQVLPLQRAVGDRGGEATTLNNMGYIYFQDGDLQRAVVSFQQVIKIFQGVGAIAEEAALHLNIANVLQQMGRIDEAITHVEQGRAILIKYDLPQAASGATLLQYDQLLAQLRGTGQSQLSSEEQADEAIRQLTVIYQQDGADAVREILKGHAPENVIETLLAQLSQAETLPQQKDDQLSISISGDIQGGNINIGGQQSFAGNINIGDQGAESNSEDDE